LAKPVRASSEAVLATLKNLIFTIDDKQCEERRDDKRGTKPQI
jgi:hypothetical protein